MDEEERNALDERVSLHKEDVHEASENNGKEAEDSPAAPSVPKNPEETINPEKDIPVNGIDNQKAPDEPVSPVNQEMQNGPIPPVNNGMPYQPAPPVGVPNHQIPPQGYGIPNHQIPPSQIYGNNQSGYGYGDGRETAQKGMAIASMVLGIVGIVLCAWFYIGIPCAIVGLVLGCIYRSKGGRNGMATAGIICSSIGLGLAVLEVCFFIMNLGYWMLY